MGAFEDPSSESAGRLKPHEDERRQGIRKPPLQVVEDAAAGQHPGRRNDHHRSRPVVQRLRFEDVAHEVNGGAVDRAETLVLELRHLEVVLGSGAAIEIHGRDRHRAVEVDRKVGGEDSPALQRAEVVEHVLRAPDGEGRDQHDALPARGLRDGAAELVARRPGRMEPVSVGRLEHEVVRRIGRLRVLQDRHVALSDVAREDDPLSVGFDRDECGAEDVSDAVERERDVARELHALVERDQREQLERAARIVGVEEGERRAVAREALPVGVAGVFFVEVGGVGPQVVEKTSGRRGDVDRTAESRLREARHVSRVVDVGVRQDDRVERRRIERRRRPVLLFQLRGPLKDAGVDEHVPRAGLENEFRAGHRSTGTQESEGRHPRRGLCRGHDARRYKIRCSDAEVSNGEGNPVRSRA